MHWRKGIGIHADAPAGLSSTAHRLTREVEIKSKIKSYGNSNSNVDSSGYRITASPHLPQQQQQHGQQRKGNGDRMSDRRAFARDARGF